MPEPDVEKAMTQAVNVASRALQSVQHRLGSAVDVQQPRILSPKEQLERFIGMDHDQLLALKRRHGEPAFNRYLVRMRQLAQEVQ